MRRDSDVSRVTRAHGMKATITSQDGAVLIIFALLLLVLIGFTALAIEAGRWYMIRAELSKSVDAAALAGAKNISNPYVDPLALAREIGQENFPSGYAGTPALGTAGTATFTAVQLSDHRIQVTGSVTALAYLAQLFGVNQVATAATGVAKKNEVEIMMVLDRTGSMGNSGKMKALQDGASSFVDYFQDTQDKDKMGLISFSTYVTVDRALGVNYVSDMKKAIQKMNPWGGTNMEDALDQADGPGGFTDQTGIPGDQRLAQFVIFFSDGMPTGFRGTFRNSNQDYDGVAYITAYTDTAKNCRPLPGEEANMFVNLGRPDMDSPLPINPTPTGDGASPSAVCSYNNSTKWRIFSSPFPGGPVPGYAPDACGILPADLALHTCRLARNMTLDRAQALKNKGIKVYVIGLGTGSQIDSAFLTQISSGQDFTYITPNPSDLQSIFNAVAKDIKLRLVQ